MGWIQQIPELGRQVVAIVSLPLAGWFVPEEGGAGESGSGNLEKRLAFGKLASNGRRVHDSTAIGLSENEGSDPLNPRARLEAGNDQLVVAVLAPHEDRLPCL